MSSTSGILRSLAMCQLMCPATKEGTFINMGALYCHHNRTIMFLGSRLTCIKLDEAPLHYASVCRMMLVELVRAFAHLAFVQYMEKQSWSAVITLTSLVFQGHGFFHCWSTTPRLSAIPSTSGGVPPACSPGILGKPQLRLNNKRGPKPMAVNGSLSSVSNGAWVSPYVSPLQSWEICLKRMTFLMQLLELPI